MEKQIVEIMLEWDGLGKVDFSCTRCGLKYRLDDMYHGQTVACIRCGEIFNTPLNSHSIADLSPIGYTNSNTEKSWKALKPQEAISDFKFNNSIFIIKDRYPTVESLRKVLEMWIKFPKSDKFIVERLDKLFGSIPYEPDLKGTIQRLKREKRRWNRTGALLVLAVTLVIVTIAFGIAFLLPVIMNCVIIVSVILLAFVVFFCAIDLITG